MTVAIEREGKRTDKKGKTSRKEYLPGLFCPEVENEKTFS